ncbi:MAG TPA: ATP-binding protein [Longimicrobiales bacterium]|nr:ATP-binding protein [Longimicrobiales bacterium]
MRVRLQILLPLVVSVPIAAGFLFAALSVGGAIRAAPPGDAAAEAARIVVLWGLLAVGAGAAAAAVVARMIVAPLTRLRDTTQRITDAARSPEDASPVAEIQDIVRGIHRTAEELRDRHTRERRERSDLATLVDAVSEGILHVDGDRRVVRVNRAGRILLGLPADAPGRTVASLVRNADLRLVLDRGSAGTGTAAAEVALDERRILVSATPLPAGGAVATFVDLTDLRRLEEIRRDFVANASHELKTPLTSIRGYTETLLAGGLPAGEQREFLDTIARNAERLQRIVDDLLDLSRLESGRWRPELAHVDVAEVARTSWQAFGERARRAGVAWELDADEQVLASADRHALDQVFTNLYDNALRYTPPDGSIRVGVRREDRGGPPSMGERRLPDSHHDGAWLVVEVADTGSGIPRDALPRVFERFYRVDPARSRAEGGTGLGLSIVKHMVETMGGAVTAESELGKGTTIRLWLPRAL